MRGLSYRIEVEEIQAWFEGYGTLDPDDIHIEETNGRRTGSALVLMESEEVAQDAKASLNKKTIASKQGNNDRFVELYDSKDTFMRKICNLPLLDVPVVEDAAMEQE